MYTSHSMNASKCASILHARMLIPSLGVAIDHNSCIKQVSGDTTKC